MVYPVADVLTERNISFVFATGYDYEAVPPRYAHIVHCEKPVDMMLVAIFRCFLDMRIADSAEPVRGLGRFAAPDGDEQRPPVTRGSDLRHASPPRPPRR
jgi:hypothetical protein